MSSNDEWIETELLDIRMRLELLKAGRESVKRWKQGDMSAAREISAVLGMLRPIDKAV